MKDNKNNIDRREFLKRLSLSAAAGTVLLSGCKSTDNQDNNEIVGATPLSVPNSGMTYRKNPKTGENVSLLGYGCMRLPTIASTSARESDEEIDREQVNRLVDYALEHGLNLFDTSPAYCKGNSEKVMGMALSRHPRNKYFLSTKLSNFAPQTWGYKESVEMYRNSLRELKTDYLDYYLLHAIGGSDQQNGIDAMQMLHKRYIDNGVLDFLLEERKAGRIRNLGFSYHGDIKVFDYLLSQHDKYHWDFVLIQMNYLDWQHANELNPANTNAEYLYAELDKRQIPIFIMEPLLGGRLANVPDDIARQFKQREPSKSIASWAFRFAGTPDRVLCVLSGMTYMEHLQDNLSTYMPLKPISQEEHDFLMHTADLMVKYPTIPCTNCKYCMPCPYGIDIPAIFAHYNTCVNEGNITNSSDDSNYAAARRAFLIGYDRSVPRLRQAAHCIGCGKCISHCPQNIIIPAEMQRIDKYVEQLKTAFSL